MSGGAGESGAAGPGGEALAGPEPEAPASPATVVALASGRRVEAESGPTSDLIRIRAATGECLLTVRFTAEGPVLSFAGAAIELAASSLRVACDDLQLVATRSARIEVGGDALTRVGGAATLEAGTAAVTATSMTLQATAGELALRASDDVRLTGERVLLNSDDPPLPLTWEEHQGRLRALEAGDAPRGLSAAGRLDRGDARDGDGDERRPPAAPGSFHDEGGD